MPFYSWSKIIKDVEEGETVPAGMTRRGIQLGRIMFGLHETTREKSPRERVSHSHESEQVTYVFEGKLRLCVGGEEQVLGPGEFMYVPSGVEHGGEAVTDHVLALDIWCPPRPDVAKRLKELESRSVQPED